MKNRTFDAADQVRSTSVQVKDRCIARNATLLRLVVEELARQLAVHGSQALPVAPRRFPSRTSCKSLRLYFRRLDLCPADSDANAVFGLSQRAMSDKVCDGSLGGEGMTAFLSWPQRYPTM